MELYRAGKEYLKTILILERKNGAVRSLDVARTLHVTKPSVSKAMRRLREDGYLTMDGSKRISLTKAGREVAEQVLDTYHILKAYLISLGVDLPVAAAVKSRTDVPFLNAVRSMPKAEVFSITPENRDDLYETLLSRIRGL